MDKKRTALGLCFGAFIIQALWICKFLYFLSFNNLKTLSKKSGRIFKCKAPRARVCTICRAHWRCLYLGQWLGFGVFGVVSKVQTNWRKWIQVQGRWSGSFWRFVLSVFCHIKSEIFRLWAIGVFATITWVLCTLDSSCLYCYKWPSARVVEWDLWLYHHCSAQSNLSQFNSSADIFLTQYWNSSTSY